MAFTAVGKSACSRLNVSPNSALFNPSMNYQMFRFSFHVAQLVISLSYADRAATVKLLALPFYFVDNLLKV